MSNTESEVLFGSSLGLNSTRSVDTFVPPRVVEQAFVFRYKERETTGTIRPKTPLRHVPQRVRIGAYSRVEGH